MSRILFSSWCRVAFTINMFPDNYLYFVTFFTSLLRVNLHKQGLYYYSLGVLSAKKKKQPQNKKNEGKKGKNSSSVKSCRLRANFQQVEVTFSGFSSRVQDLKKPHL